MVVLSSCTNYDDQFDDLNSQLSTLKTQIDGFTALSSGVTALQGTVSSLQAAVALLPKTATPATDISGLQTALTALAATVAELKTSLAGAATSAEVATLAANLATAQTDLTNLLAANNVYAPVNALLTVSTQAELDFATALGDRVSIINGAVTITQSASMNAAQLGTLMGKIASVTGAVIYSTTVSTTTSQSFTNLIGALSVSLNQTGDIVMPKLVSTGALALTGDTKTTIVSFSALTSVASGLSALSFAKATSVSFPVLATYDGAISITTDNDASVDLSVLTSAAATVGYTTVDPLTVVNAKTLIAPMFDKGTITGNKVLSVSLPKWEGTATSSFAKAKTAVLPSISAIKNGNLNFDVKFILPEATSVHIIGASAAGTTTSEVSVTTLDQSNIETLILGGVFDSVTIENNTDLVTLTFVATAENVTIDNTDLVTASIAFTAVGGATSTTSKPTLTVKDNDALSSFTASKVNGLIGLNISNNRNLKTVSMPDLAAAAAAATVTITDNDFSGTVTYTDVAETAGTLASTSGLKELKNFLSSAITGRTSSVPMKVELDAATTLSSTGDETNPATYYLVNLETAVSTTVGAIGAKKEAKAFTLVTDGVGVANIKIGDDWIFVNSAGAKQDITPSANMALAAVELASSTAVTRAAALGVDLSAQVGATVGSITVSFTATNDSATVESNIANAATVSATAMTANQYATLTIGSNTVTATNTDTVGGIATSLVNAYNAKYTTASSLYVVTDNASKIVISVAENSGNRAHNASVSISATTASAVAGGANPILGYVIGATKATTDNKMVGTRVIVRLQNKLDGNTLPTIAFPSTNSSSVLTTTLNYATATTFDDYAGNQWPGDARGIVEPYFVGTGGTTTTTGTTSTINRTSFL